MSEGQVDENDVKEHYSVSAATYRDHYNPDTLLTSPTYPAEYFRLENLLARFRELNVSRVLDAGCGEGTPMLKMARQGANVRGFDFTPEMVADAKALFGDNGLDPDWVAVANVEKFESFEPLVAEGAFDAAVCFGVMPHVSDEVLSLRNLRRSLKVGGRVFVEFRNALFNLFTFNRFTHSFIVDELLADASDEIRLATGRHVKSHVDMNVPPLRLSAEAGKPGYDAIRARMHNPLAMPELFTAGGFRHERIHWYHFHPTLPALEGNGVDPAAFRKAAIAMEKNPGDPRGAVLCSAYVVEATVD